MKRKLISLIPILFLIPGNGNAQSQINYPETRQDKVQEVHFGQIVEDPYRWMEKAEPNEIKAWVSQQDDLLQQYLQDAPIRTQIAKRLEELTYYDLYTVPQKRGESYFYAKAPAGKSRASLYYQKGKSGYPVELINPDSEFSDGQTQLTTRFSNGGFKVNLQGNKIFTFLALGQSRWLTGKVYDIRGKRFLKDELKDLHLLGNMSWSLDGKGFYYIRFEKNESANNPTPQSPKVYYHQLNTIQAEDKLIFQTEQEGNWYYQLYTTPTHLLVHATDGNSGEQILWMSKLGNSNPTFQPLFKSKSASISFLGGLGQDWYFFTNDTAPNGKIVAYNLKQKEFRMVVAEQSEPIAGGSQVGGNAFGLFGNHLAAMYYQEGLPFLKVFDLSGKLLYRKDLPIDGSIWGGLVGDAKENLVYFQFLGFTDPSSIYEMNITNGNQSVFLRSNCPFQSSKYVTYRVFYNSKDGTRIPMFVSHRKDLQRNSNNPAFMYGYGAFSWNSFLWYQPHILVWLEMGGIYALPAIRGGGEYGKDWHEAGKRHNRHNAIDDYIAAAKWLVDQKYTSPQKLAANGGSASASLTMSAVLSNPDNFGACVVDRPALDMLRYHKLSSADFWVQEFGDPEVEEDFQTLRSWSPYHNLESGKCYPPTLLMSGDKDELTPPIHSHKFIAAMQLVQNCENPVLLKTMWGAGHNFGATSDQVVDSWADALAFLAKSMGLNEKRY
ncbi:MAG: S9 family peptidase [Saprospiraceae bacterium]|nr:S9 family peptidase [Saprospiraceae bacterium]